MNVSGPGLVSCFILGSCLILESAEIISITVSKLSNYISTQLSPPPRRIMQLAYLSEDCVVLREIYRRPKTASAYCQASVSDLKNLLLNGIK